MRSIKQIKYLSTEKVDFKNKKVLLRVDFNVPLDGNKILDDFRIKKTLPTIEYLINKGAKVIIITHLGKDGSLSLNPVISYFFKISKISKNKVEFYENIRKFDGETKNDMVFAKKLASLGDIYVNDAFSVSHREHASIVLLPKLLPSYAGFQLEEEIKNLSLTFSERKRQFLAILGGAKFSTKMPLIEKYLKVADFVFVGGALLNNFIKASGFEVGQSILDKDINSLNKIIKNKKFIFAKDVVVLNPNGKKLNKKINSIEKEEVVLDIGKDTIAVLENYIKKAKLILWNGPLGKYENGGDVGTKKILHALSNSNAKSIIGGGDLVSLAKKIKRNKNLFVSTGGGATLEFLVNKTLPGIKALL